MRWWSWSVRKLGSFRFATGASWSGISLRKACANGSGSYCSRRMKEVFTKNIMAKLVALVLATLLWAVIKRGQVAEPMTLQPKAQSIEFGAGAYGK